MAKRLTKTEKVMLEITDRSQYKVYRCPEHGVFAQRNDVATGECAYKCDFKATEGFFEG